MGSSHFFVVGAQRSGTTHLHSLLAAHPEIEMAVPVRPEPKFFLRDELFSKGLSHYEKAFFPGKPGAWLRGEKTVSYLESSKAARRIADSYPDAKIVCVLRDPIERAISHYWYSHEHGIESLSMEDAFSRDDRELTGSLRTLSMSPFAYLKRGCYVKDLPRYEALFPRRSLILLLYEDLTRDEQAFQDLCRRLGVSDEVACSAPVDPETPRKRSGASGLPPKLRDCLVRYFEGPNAELAERYGLDLSAWARP